MNKILFYSFFLFSILRISSVFISKRNEKRLIAEGATEYGVKNTKILAILHTIFYFSCFAESYYKSVQLNSISIVGYCVYIFSIAVLVYIINKLNPIWTVKLIIASDHKLNNSPIFKYIRHPNYFLNIIPELIGISLIFQSFYTLIILFPVYLISLHIRIKQENNIMKQTFPNY